MIETVEPILSSGASRRRGLVLFTFLTLSTLAIMGCTVSLLPPYDQGTVDSVTALLKKIDTFLIQQQSYLESGQASLTTYEHNKPWYDDAQEDLNVITIRARAIPKNENTVKQLGLLAGAFSDLIDANKKGFTKAYLSNAQRIVDQAIGAILAAEFAKKTP